MLDSIVVCIFLTLSVLHRRVTVVGLSVCLLYVCLLSHLTSGASVYLDNTVSGQWRSKFVWISLKILHSNVMVSFVML